MKGPSRVRVLGGRIALALILVVAVQASSFALSVIVNGKVLPPTPPAVSKNGHVLLPMRMVFEALGATVKWEDATQTATGTRGDVTVRMSINQNIAYINDRAVPLDVPPQLLNGSTYVPVRFPAEAFGAKVGWNDAAQIVTVDLEPLATVEQPPTPPEPPAQPAQPAQPVQPVQPVQPAPQPGTVSGVIAAPQAGRVTLIVGNDLKILTVTPTTIILENQAQVAPEALKVGDAAEVQHDGLGNAVIVRATYATVDGVVQAKVPNQLLLDTQAQPFKVAAEAGILAPTGQAATYGDLRVGDRVTLRITPGTSDVYGILIQQPVAGAEPPQPEVVVPAGPRIDRFFHDADRPLRAGQQLNVVLEGTPGGRARFDIGDVRRDIELREERGHAGRYRARYRVEEGLTAMGVPLIGHLEVEGQRAEAAESAEPVIIDTTPPVIQIFGPRRGEHTTNRRPNLSFRITDEGGSGVDTDRTTVTALVGNQAVPLTVTAHGQFFRVDTEDLPLGHVTLSIEAFDKAGNEARSEGDFTVAEAGQGGPGGGVAALSVSHDAPGVLMPGDALTVTATGPTGGHAALDLGDWRNNVPMQEVAGNPGTYRARIPIPDQTADRTLTPRVRLRTAGGQDLQADATAPVMLSRRRTLAPVLTSPTADQRVGNQVVIEGDTQPMAQLTIIVSWHGTLLRVLEQQGQVAETQVTADAHGHFKTEPIPLKVGSVLPVKDVTYTVSVVATSAHGETSEPVEVTFSQ